MAQPDFLKYSSRSLVARWRSFERWSQPLSGVQFYGQGIQGFTINGAGGLQGDPVLTLPSIPNNYSRLILSIKAKCATQQSFGSDVYPLTLNNYGCGYANNGTDGIVVNGIVQIFAFSGEFGELHLQEVPQTIDFSSLFLQYLIDSSYNSNSFPLGGAGSKYVAMKFDVSLYGSNTD